MKNREVFLHLQNRLPDLLDHRNTKLAVFFDGAQHSLAGPADFAIRSGRGAGLDVRKDGADDGVVFIDGAKFSGVIAIMIWVRPISSPKVPMVWTALPPERRVAIKSSRMERPLPFQ